MKLTIAGSGSYLPPTTVENRDFTRIVDTSDEWIRSRTGIFRRHFSDGELTVEMGVKAAEKALADAKLAASELDLILVSSVTPDYVTPTVSCLLQGYLGAAQAFALDINVACSGFVYGLDLAARYLQDPSIRHVLLVASEKLSRVTDFTDRSTCVLFGDGAAAVVLTANGPGEELACCLKADGRQAQALTACYPDRNHPFGAAPASLATPPAGKDRMALRFPQATPFIHMDGREVYRFAVGAIEQGIRAVTASAGYQVEQLDWLIPHQANNRILEAAAKRLNLPMDKVYSCLDEIGNTSSSSVGIALDRCRQQGLLQGGQLVAFSGFGGGLTHGTVLLKI
ncbi:MAG: ketoacyl-ACP synthase III [Oscillospiraceae bacterium]|nr:ketoacyl-ACP synthase III [Oscillospiraceae bacterium]MDD4368266.1 ketoacyl-ACP synthase III [Oscillospiraceae bacterium]